MIWNIIDCRTRPYRWKRVNAIIESIEHDNICADADQAPEGEPKRESTMTAGGCVRRRSSGVGEPGQLRCHAHTSGTRVTERPGLLEGRPGEGSLNSGHSAH